MAKFRQMGEIQVLGGDGFFADGDGEIWLQNSRKWTKLGKFAIFGLFLTQNLKNLKIFSDFFFQPFLVTFMKRSKMI